MEGELFTLGHGIPGAEVLDERGVQAIFGLLDHVVVLNEAHLLRVARGFLA